MQLSFSYFLLLVSFLSYRCSYNDDLFFMTTSIILCKVLISSQLISSSVLLRFAYAWIIVSNFYVLRFVALLIFLFVCLGNSIGQ